MGDVEDHADAIHLAEEGRAFGEEAAFGASAVSIGADAVVGRADEAQAGVPPMLHLIGRQHCVGPFHAQDEAERLVCPFGRGPGVHVHFERRPVLDPA